MRLIFVDATIQLSDSMEVIESISKCAGDLRKMVKKFEK